MSNMGQIFSTTKPVSNEPYLFVFDALEKGRIFKLQHYREEIPKFAEITKNGKGLLHHSVIHGQAKCLRYLINCGLDVNRCDLAQSAPILEIVQCKSKNSSELEEILQILVKSGANINATNAHKRTALLKSIIQFRHNVSTLLVKFGADANIADIDGLLPIHVCATYSSLPVLRLILESKANVNAQDRKGRTALYFAVLSGHQNIVDELLKYGSDVNLGSLLGYPLQTAIVKCKCEAVKALLLHGANIHCTITENRQSLAKSKDYLNLALTLLSIELFAYQSVIQKANSNLDQSVTDRLRRLLYIIDMILQGYCGDINISKNVFFKTKKPQYIDSLPDSPLSKKLKRLCNKLNFIHWLANPSTATALEGIPKEDNLVRFSLENMSRMRVRKLISQAGTNVIHIVDKLDCSVVLKDLILVKDI